MKTSMVIYAQILGLFDTVWFHTEVEVYPPESFLTCSNLRAHVFEISNGTTFQLLAICQLTAQPQLSTLLRNVLPTEFCFETKTRNKAVRTSVHKRQKEKSLISNITARYFERLSSADSWL